MSDENTKTVAETPKIKLQEYCILKSKKDKRVELLAGFEFHMKRVLKKQLMTMEEFEKQFESYLNLPA